MKLEWRMRRMDFVSRPPRDLEQVRPIRNALARLRVEFRVYAARSSELVARTQAA